MRSVSRKLEISCCSPVCVGQVQVMLPALLSAAAAATVPSLPLHTHHMVWWQPQTSTRHQTAFIQVSLGIVGSELNGTAPYDPLEQEG